jgi:hypothetical protein
MGFKVNPKDAIDVAMNRLKDKPSYSKFLARQFAEIKESNEAFRNALDSLKKVKRGFYKLPGSEAPSPVDELILLVHSYDPSIYVSNRVSPNYTQNLSKIVKDYDSPVLLAMEFGNLAGSVDWLKSIASTKPRIIYITEDNDPVPLELTEDKLLDGILELFNPSSIRLGGAALEYCDREYDKEFHQVFGEWRGCVGHTYNWLADKRFSTDKLSFVDVYVDEELCWTPDGCCSNCSSRTNYEKRKASLKPRPEELERLLCKEGS